MLMFSFEILFELRRDASKPADRPGEYIKNISNYICTVLYFFCKTNINNDRNELLKLLKETQTDKMKYDAHNACAYERLTPSAKNIFYKTIV